MTDELEPISKRISNARHRKFIDEYFKLNMNATRAYIAVYGAEYESARRLASQLLTNIDISEEIERRLQESAMGANEVLARLAEHARGDIGDYALIDNNKDLAEHELSRVVKKFKRRVWYTPDGERQEEIELELYDAHAALVDLGKRWSLFTDKFEGSIKIDGSLVILPPQDG